MKRIVAFSIAVLLCCASFAQRPKVGVVLSGGGAKGAAHIGVLKVLEEYNIPVDYIVGASMGSIIGGLYAVGYTADELDSLIMQQDWQKVILDQQNRRDIRTGAREREDKYLLRIPFGGGKSGKFLTRAPMALVRGQNVYNLFSKLTVGYQDSLDFNKLPIPFSCVAVDLVHKEEVVFHSGSLAQAMRASMSIPFFFAPVRIGNTLLVDGGMLNNYPVDLALDMGADIIIGSRMGESEHEDVPEIDDAVTMGSEWLDLYMRPKMEANIGKTDIFITPKVGELNVMSFDEESMRTLVANGVEAAREKAPELLALRELLDQYETEPLKPAVHKAKTLGRDTIKLGYVSYNGLNENEIRVISRHTRLRPGASVTGDQLEREVSRLFNTEAFEYVTYALKGEEEPYDLELNFVPGRKSVFGIGAFFDTEEVAAILLNFGLNANSLYGSKLNVSAKLAYNFQGDAEYSYNFHDAGKAFIDYHFRYSNMNVLHQENLSSSMVFDQHSASAGYAVDNLRNFTFKAGAQLDFFKFKSLLEKSEYLKNYDYDPQRNTFFSVFVKYGFDNFDRATFPTRGFKMDLGGSYYFDFFSNKDHTPFVAVNAKFMGAIPIGKRFAIIPSLEHRTLSREDAPMAFMNIMGGYMPGRYMNQQMAFVGFNTTHAFDNHLTLLNIDTRARIGKDHYVFLSGAAAASSDTPSMIASDKLILGARVGYSYDSRLGPLSFNLNWSNYTNKVGVYLSLGHAF